MPCLFCNHPSQARGDVALADVQAAGGRKEFKQLWDVLLFTSLGMGEAVAQTGSTDVQVWKMFKAFTFVGLW